MRMSKKKALNAALIVTGLAIAALGTVLYLTSPAERVFSGHRGFEYSRDQRQSPAYDFPRPGYYAMPGMRHFGGGAFVVLGLLLIGGIAFKRRHGHGAVGKARCPSREEDAISLLRREFAEGRVSEDDYRKRLDALLR